MRPSLTRERIVTLLKLSLARIDRKLPASLSEKIGTIFLFLKKLVFHPIFVFVVLQIVSISITAMWVTWYVNRDIVFAMPRIAAQYDLGYLIAGVVLSIIILLGSTLLFVYAIKQSLLNRQQRSFVSSVTHELRSPIASMQLSLETIMKRQLNQSTLAKFHNMMASDLDRLVRLVDQILVSARLDRGIRIVNEFEEFHIKPFLEGLIVGCRHLDQNIYDRVKIDCREDLRIYAAKPAISLIMTNLIENAIKYSPEKSPIRIKARLRGKHMVISVHDQGFGLDKRDRKRIFSIFRRGAVAAKKAIPGTGLGLYIVSAICKALNGRVWAESPGLDKGTSFHVTLPLTLRTYEDCRDQSAQTQNLIGRG